MEIDIQLASGQRISVLTRSSEPSEGCRSLPSASEPLNDPAGRKKFVPADKQLSAVARGSLSGSLPFASTVGPRDGEMALREDFSSVTHHAGTCPQHDEADRGHKSTRSRPVRPRGARALAVLVQLASIALDVCYTPARADTPLAVANNEFSLSTGAHNLLYHELDSYHQTGGAYLDSESGTQPVVRTTASRQGTLFGISDVYSAVELAIAAGHTSYTGYSILAASPQGIGAPLTQNKFGMTVDAEMKLGRSFGLFESHRFQFTPYLDYGYHLWARDRIETYTDHFAGLGLLTQFAVSARLVVDADLTVDRMIVSQLHTAHGINEALAPGTVRSLRLGADYRVAPRIHITTMWQAQSFCYGQSTTVTGWYSGMYGNWYEPTSKTIEQLFVVGVAYAF